MSDAAAPDNPIAITGMHRSGTSMITRGLHQSGLHLVGGDADALLAAADDNPEGFWENKAIVSCNDDLLEAAGGSWDNPPRLLPMAVDDPRLVAIVEPATAALAGLAENQRWGFKDPRTCLTAAFWLDLQPDLRFVICVRNPLEVALSLKRRNQNSYSLGLSLWERYYESVLELVPEERRIVTHYDTYFLDPVGELARVCEFAGLTPAVLDVRNDLRHHDVGVGLDEANLGSGIRDLYTRLCEEAGAPIPPASVADEGHVRRLVLDGTVAARHAAERQEAIQRLEERLGESQAAEKEAREQLAQVRRESESRRAELVAITRELDYVRADSANRFDVLEAQSLRLLDSADTVAEVVHRLEARQQATLERTNHIGEILDAVHVKLRTVEKTVQHNNRVLHQSVFRRAIGGVIRRIRARGVPAAKKSVKTTAGHLPQPVRHNVHRVRRAVADGQAGNRVKERTSRLVNRLPAPAQSVARKGNTAVRQSGAVPKVKRVARGAARRLPAPVKRLVRSAARSAPAARGNTPTRPKKASAAPRPQRRDDGRATQVPKGPAGFKWQKSYERLVNEFVGRDTSWAVATPGCKPGVGSVAGRTGVAFPSTDGQPPAADSLALIAILEAMRLRGTQLLVVPEGARAWFRSHPELRDHLTRSHRMLCDREGAGVVFDLTSAAVDRPGLLTTVRDLSVGRHELPAVLDWTDLGLAADLPGLTTFVPVGEVTTTELPYFDDSVEVVVTTARHDLGEATRVASVAVVVCERVGPDLQTEAVYPLGAAAAPGRSVVAVATPSGAEVDAAVRSRVDEFGAELRLGASPSSIEDAEVVLVVEAGVVPLPGAIDEMVKAVQRAPEAVSVAKVLDDHGRVESAGGTVFDDGSIAGIAEGTLDVRAPWHEFSRPVCWGGGIVAAAAQVWASLPDFDPDDPVNWFGDVWASGPSVEYRSAATVVRVDGCADRPPTASGAWAQRLAGRPRRPAELGDGAWRYLLANDDVRALASEDLR